MKNTNRLFSVIKMMSSGEHQTITREDIKTWENVCSAAHWHWQGQSMHTPPTPAGWRK